MLKRGREEEKEGGRERRREKRREEERDIYEREKNEKNVEYFQGS